MNIPFNPAPTQNSLGQGTTNAGLLPDEFQYLIQMIKDMSGIALAEDKGYLIETRLLPIARENGLRSLQELVQGLRSGRPGLASQVINAMVTHETLFFRDKTPFDNFTEVMLPDLIKRNAQRRSLRIWCAASSSGQEPYSLALLRTGREAQLAGWTGAMLGTDLSGPVVERARRG
ncbi:MAG: CheR family methyltransferase, partial [Holosporales bacterium]